ncbi:MAG: hypothetical protein HKN51_02035 [Saprospiraceae bacterium]|nr:hypothetical protein [Saprospiraceae bacterium]
MKRIFSGKLNNDTGYLVFYLILLFFVISKLKFLNLPFYWDEAWVYGNAITQFINEGMHFYSHESTIELTRGHPLMFYILAFLWGKVFGGSLVSLHLFALFISVGLLLFIFYKLKDILSINALLICIAFLSFNELFFTQASLLLPEVMLGSFCLFAFYFALTNKWQYYILFYGLAMLVKESALVLFPFILLSILYDDYTEKKISYRRYLLASIPLVFILGHFIQQKISLGWYLFPAHVGHIDLNLRSVSNKFSQYYRTIFDARYLFVFSLLFIGALCKLLKLQNPHDKRINTYIKVVIFAIILFLGFNIPHKNVFGPGFILMITIGIGLLHLKYKSALQKKFICIGWFFILGYLLFSAANFYSVRYTIIIIIFYSIIFSFVLNELMKVYNWKIQYVLIAIMLIMTLGRNQKREFGDTDTGYADVIKNHKSLVKYLNDNVDKDVPIEANFIERAILTNANCRYVKEGQEFLDVESFRKSDKDVWILSNLELSLETHRKFIDKKVWEKVKTIKNRKSICEIYMKK